MVDSEDLDKCFPEGVTYLPGVSGTASQFYSSRPADPQHYFSHHHHYRYQPPVTSTQSSAVDDHQLYLTRSAGSSMNATSPAPQQHSSSSLTQHQAHHNFWSDISGGGSSIPSSLLATSSSSLSSSTGLPMSSGNNFDGIDTPLTVASCLLDMQYNAVEMPRNTQKLRPRPESCVNTRSDALTRPDQTNRPKSSCGSLTVSNSNHSSPDRTLLAPPDLDETISAANSCDARAVDYGGAGSYYNSEETCGLQTANRIVNQARVPHYLHHRHQHHHMHFHQSAIDSIISQSLSSMNATSSAVQSANSESSAKGANFTASAHILGARNNSNCSVSSNNFGAALCGSFGTPPPPLPPKPKLGVPPRGPPPRPPSRQLPLALSAGALNYVRGLPSVEGQTPDKLHQDRGAEKGASADVKDQDSISFV